MAWVYVGFLDRETRKYANFAEYSYVKHSGRVYTKKYSLQTRELT